MTCREGHPPRHPDYEIGNAAALRHGARSPRIVEPIAATLKAEAVAAAPYLENARWAGELDAWARAEARVQVLLAYEAKVGGPLDDEGTPRSYLTELDRAERRASNARDRLGLNPASGARLAAYLAGAERALSLAQLWARQAEQEAAERAPGRPAEGLGGTDD